jgi:hypothetical protein
VHILLLPRTTRPGGSKCATRELARKLHLACHLRFRGYLPVGCKSRKHKTSGDTSASATGGCPEDHTIFAKPNYLALLLSRQSPSGDAVEEHRLRIVIWLILPVVICLSQRLSHACLSISIIQRNCEWLIKTVIVYLIIETYMDTRGNSRANTCWCARLLRKGGIY